MAWQPDREELAWAAGLFDGEGYVACGFQKSGNKGPSSVKRYRKLSIQITQADPGVLDRFQKAVGGLGSIGGPYYSDKRRNKNGPSPMWKYHTGGFESTQAVVAMIFPFLSSIKRDAARRALLAWHTNSPSTV